MIYKQYDVVVVPFPFSNLESQKRRPVVIISSNVFNVKTNHYITAMITSAKRSHWEFDAEIKDWKSAGLDVQCLIRMKLFTAEKTLIIKKIGELSELDRQKLTFHIDSVLSH